MEFNFFLNYMTYFHPLYDTERPAEFLHSRIPLYTYKYLVIITIWQTRS